MGTMIIGEVAQAHDGSLGAAHAYIDAIANAGADAVKFQTHIASAESTPSEPWRVKFSLQDETRFDYWRRTSFTEEQWAGLKKHADERGLQFLSSPFSVEAAQLLMRVGVSAWKIASGEANNPHLLDYMASTGLPVLLSTGMSRLSEIDTAVERIQSRNLPVTVMQCTTSYPCPAGTFPGTLPHEGGIVGPFGRDLCRIGRGVPGRRCSGGSRDLQPGMLRPRCAGVADHFRIA
jgi:N-acetylneuraminate synthase